MNDQDSSPVPPNRLTGSGRTGSRLSMSGGCLLLLTLIMPLGDCGGCASGHMSGYDFAFSGTYSPPYLSALITIFIASKWMAGSPLGARTLVGAWLVNLVAWAVIVGSSIFAAFEKSGMRYKSERPTVFLNFGLLVGFVLWIFLALSIAKRSQPLQCSARITWITGSMSTLFFGLFASILLFAREGKVFYGTWVSIVASLGFLLGGWLVERWASKAAWE